MHERILVVDDEPLFHFSTELALRKQGYQVSEAYDGKEAMEMILAAEENRPSFDLVLLDLELPSMSGVEILLELSKRGVKVPVMVVSGCVTAETYRTLMQFACLDVLFKPVSEQMLLGRIEELLRKSLPDGKIEGAGTIN